MNKNDLIQALSTTNGISKRERVEIRSLCTFYVKSYEGYAGRNPKTGETVAVATKKVPVFKCGKGLRERVDSQS